MNVIETTGLGKRYGKAWALRDCTLAVPEGSPGRARRAERLGQVHADEHGGRA